MKNDLIAHLNIDLTLDEVIGYWAAKKPEGIALQFDPSYSAPPLTWRQFEQYVQGCACELSKTISRKDVVAVVCDDHADFHVLVNALWRCGAAVLLLNRTWGLSVVADLLELTGAKTLFSKNREDEMQYPGIAVENFPALGKPISSLASTASEPDDVAILATTSGTTDNPKCVPITHRQIRTAYHTALKVRDFRSVQQAASLFPLNGIGVMGVCFLLPREIGASTYVFPPFSMATITDSWRRIFEKKIDFVYLVPALVRLLNALPVTLERAESMMAFCAAAPIDQKDLRALEQKYPLQVYNVYGLTELTFAVFFGARADDGQATDSIGRPIGIEARIVDENGEDSDAGELYIRGPMSTEKYLDNPEATAQSWVDGWLRTGDLAMRDGAGLYYVSGRIKDAVIRGGILHYFHEIEFYLRKAPQVIDACAFKGQRLPSGDELCVVVQVAEDADQSVLMEWIKKHIGEEKVPNKLYLQQHELQRNANGKIMRREVADMYNSEFQP